MADFTVRGKQLLATFVRSGHGGLAGRRRALSTTVASPADVVQGPAILKTSVHRPSPSLINLPGLRSLPFWTNLRQEGGTQVAYCDPTLERIVRFLEEHANTILDEYKRNHETVPSDYDVRTEHETLHQGQWDWHSYMTKGKVQAGFFQQFPETFELLQQLRDDKVLFEGTPFGYSFFSKLHPKFRIKPHTAPMNFRLRVHLPLIVPEESNSEDIACGIRVGPIVKRWTPGKAMILDDAFDHEVWNETDQVRVLLLIDFWHPDFCYDTYGYMATISYEIGAAFSWQSFAGTVNAILKNDHIHRRMCNMIYSSQIYVYDCPLDYFTQDHIDEKITKSAPTSRNLTELTSSNTMTTTPATREETTAQGVFDRGVSTAQGFLGKLFRSCEGDAKGSVHKLWGVVLLLVVVNFIVSIVEMINIQAYGGSQALVIGSIWTGFFHVALAVLGTFVLKRFPTSFSIGFLLGVILILANQNLIIFATFHGYPYGRSRTNHIYANVSLALFVVLTLFGLLLAHFKEDVTVAAIDVKGIGGGRSAASETEGP